MAQICLPTQETQETWVQSLGWEDPLEVGTADSSTPAWKNLWTKKPGGLSSIGSQRVGHNPAHTLYPRKLSLWIEWIKPHPEGLIFHFLTFLKALSLNIVTF